jgi:hypothetical protein
MGRACGQGAVGVPVLLDTDQIASVSDTPAPVLLAVELALSTRVMLVRIAEMAPLLLRRIATLAP